ncbi:MAG: magnesium transporter MgtE N-terminal domain-containing protein, partial [bacterium]
VYFSDYVGKPVVDIDNRLVGKVFDLTIGKPEENYPLASGITIKEGSLKARFAKISWDKINTIGDPFRLKIKASEINFTLQPFNSEFSLRRDILDQQVVDTFNQKVIRVNDIHLLRVDHELRLAHVDIGLRGIVRRLGWEKLIDFWFKIFAPNSNYLKKEPLVSWKFVQTLSVGQTTTPLRSSLAREQLLSIPAPDLGEMMLDLDLNVRVALFRLLDAKTKAKIFESLNVVNRVSILEELETKEVVEIIENMSPDEATDLLENLPKELVNDVLNLMEGNRAKKLYTLLGYSSDSAGGIMTTEYIALTDKFTVAQALEKIKGRAKDVEFIPQYLCVVDDTNKLVGTTTLLRLIAAVPDIPITSVMVSKPIFVHLDASLREVAYMMDKYQCSTIPVLDRNHIVQGIITEDDILGRVIAFAWRRKIRPKRKPKRL